ncbi:DUF1232 domain-containing protein [Vogesella sp. LYT5W]|uniref:DUF1232 domain-containing protein n=1 Tax=Vogesella margarita TaxID=2984199 RepID=A0ABT5IQT2_9NEIS|nr:DUF1232 domain-containing protein [Vogesella margarita]MDC7714926.1 DUF1232 domain-containing protein [Vogesella margarita]
MSFLATARCWAHQLKRDVVTVYFAARHPATPYWLRLLALLVAAYALSPIDLIPDFVPLLGYVDDLLLLPLGLLLVLRCLPPAVLAECRAHAAALLTRPRSRRAAAVIVGLWLGGALALAWYAWPR